MGRAVKVFLLFSLFTFNFSLVLSGQTINNLQWQNAGQEVTEATIGMGVTLYAQTKSINDGEPVTVLIWSKCGEADDLVGRFVSRVNNNRIAFHWILDFIQEDLPSSEREIKENGYTRPRYYFEIRYNAAGGPKSELLALKARSRKLIFDGDTGEPWTDHRILLILPDKTEVITRTDTEGYVTVDNIKAIGMIYFALLIDTEEEHEIIQPPREPENPAYYIIKESDRSLRDIAAYDFIYGDPGHWERLYAANRHNFIDDRNPAMFQTGQALIIPPAGDEIREGTR
jgi:hypothetical protein